MIFPTEFGELILEREYTWEKNGVKTPLLVQIDKPRRLEADWYCCWRFSSEEGIHHAFGVDSLQATNNAFTGIEKQLKDKIARGETIYWLMPGMDLMHNHDISTRVALAGILKQCRDYLRLDDMPTELRESVEASMAWGKSLQALNKNASEKPAKAKKPEKVKGPSARQLDYLRFINAWIELHRQAPSEAEIVWHMRVTAPSAHDMIVKLEELGYLARTPGVARSLRVLIDPKLLKKP